jgi:CO/xanthine dehydrogenase FAD-binding subunit
VKPASFENRQPSEIGEAAELLAERREAACVLAGSQSLMLELNTAAPVRRS